MGAVALRCCCTEPFMPLFGRGWEASRRWMADCKLAGRPGRGGAVPDRRGAAPARGGAVPDRGWAGSPTGCDMAGDPTLKTLGICGCSYWSGEEVVFE